MGAPGRLGSLVNNMLLHKDKLLDQIPRKLQHGLILIRSDRPAIAIPSRCSGGHRPTV